MLTPLVPLSHFTFPAQIYWNKKRKMKIYNESKREKEEQATILATKIGVLGGIKCEGLFMPVSKGTISNMDYSLW